MWDASTFAKNRDRFLEMDAAAELLAGVVNHPDVRRQMSRDYFSVDGTLIDALRGLLAASPSKIGSIASWRSMGFDEELEPRDDPGGGASDTGRNAERDFRGVKRSNETHASTTDPDAWLYERRMASRAGCASSAPRLWRTATASWSMAA